MSSVVRWASRSLTAVLASTAIAWGGVAVPAPGPAPAATAVPAPEPYIVPDPDHGPPGERVVVYGYGFQQCYDPPLPTSDDAAGPTPRDIHVTWQGANPSIARADLDSGEFEADMTAPSDAAPGTYEVRAECVGIPAIHAEAWFTVDGGGSPSQPPATPDVTLDPTEGPAGTESVKVFGSGFTCPSVDVLWDGASVRTVDVGGDGSFATALDVATDAEPAEHTVRAQCTASAETGDEAGFTVVGPPPSEPPTDSPSDSPDTSNTPDTPDTPDSVDAIPFGLVVGSSFLGVALLAIAGAVLLNHRPRGPRWVQQHVSARLRPTAGLTDVAEPYEGAGPGTRSVRLEPHADPGDLSVKEDGT
ncbi:hypothetical protein [Streptomyces bambusae]|uniref:Ig-like domain-containing protein n=1 Tax=Streptomyces bambusae TaxID=1550616 RepID=A0ABS6Z6L5_9ACTN|nr:hypothetical protein [Streptomyces bambusae]MBW5483211.1 hypothetical protein [Streptomyces bambusae]